MSNPTAEQRGKVKAARDGNYRYSQEIPGYESNHNWAVTFDVVGHCVGINQGRERVLLSPAQYKALVRFVELGK